MPMARTTLFQTNRSQAVRLSKDVAFPAGVREVAVLRDGHRRVIDIERDQPAVQEREAF